MSAQPDEPVAQPPPNEVTAGPDPLARRQLLLHRRIVNIGPDRIEVRPPRSLLVLPALGVGLTSFVAYAIVTWTDTLPFWVLPLLLLVAVVALPLSGLGLIYAIFGANVVADRVGQSVSWKQGYFGMGVGTTELAPFWKIREFVVEDVGRAQRRANGTTPAHGVAQWELSLIKKSGKRLTLGSVSVPREYEEVGLDLIMEVAAAFSAISGVPVRGPIW